MVKETLLVSLLLSVSSCLYKDIKKTPISVARGIGFSESKNKWFFKTKIFPIIKREECGDCKKLCHLDPKDRGGLTCAGVSIKHNASFFVKELNSFNDNCQVSPVGKLICDKRLIVSSIRDVFFNKYAKVFSSCSKKAFPMLVDSSVLEGKVTAIKHLQKAHGLKADGLFGPKTKKVCQQGVFNAKAFTESRLNRIRSLTQYPRYGKGWEKRIKRKLLEYNLQ